MSAKFCPECGLPFVHPDVKQVSDRRTECPCGTSIFLWSGASSLEDGKEVSTQYTIKVEKEPSPS